MFSFGSQSNQPARGSSAFGTPQASWVPQETIEKIPSSSLNSATSSGLFTGGTSSGSMTTPIVQQRAGSLPNVHASSQASFNSSQPMTKSYFADISATPAQNFSKPMQTPSYANMFGISRGPIGSSQTTSAGSSMDPYAFTPSGKFPSSATVDFGTGKTTIQPTAAYPPLLAIQAIYAAYDLNSPFCKFKHIFYNKVSSAEVSRYERPTNVEESLWNQAMTNNPDPLTMVPVQAVGSEDLLKRIRSQEETTQLHIAKLKEMGTISRTLQREHDLHTNVNLDKFKRLLMQQYQRLIKLMSSLELLKSRGASIMSSEDSFRARLESIQKELERPNQHRSKIELMTDHLERLRDARSTPSSSHSQYQLVDPDSLQQICKFLLEQQEGLAYLTEIVDKCTREFHIIKRGYTESGREP